MNLLEMVKESGLKQTYIAEKLGVTRQYFNQMLNGTKPMLEKYERQVKELCNKQLV